MPCDLCSGAIDANSTRYTNSQFRSAVKAGLRPSLGMFALYKAMGATQEQAEALWVQQVMSDTTDWILCTDCTELTRRFFPAKAAGKGCATVVAVGMLVGGPLIFHWLF